MLPLGTDDVIHEMDCWLIPETRQEHRSRTYFQIRLCQACWPNRAFITETGKAKKTNIHCMSGTMLGSGLALSRSALDYCSPHFFGDLVRVKGSPSPVQSQLALKWWHQGPEPCDNCLESLILFYIFYFMYLILFYLFYVLCVWMFIYHECAWTAETRKRLCVPGACNSLELEL